MQTNNYEIMVLSETNVNMSSYEKWDGYTCFFSSGIDPKVREKEEMKREQSKGRGKGKSPILNYRSAPDYENAGVAIVIKNSIITALKDVKQINGRIMKVTFEAHGSEISFFAVYAPHSLHDIEVKDTFYKIARARGVYYIGGDFNARIHHVREVDVDVCGPHILGRGREYLDSVNESTRESRDMFLGFAKLHSLKIMNTFFSKPPEKLITYKNKVHNAGSDTEAEVGPPFDAIKYGQLDFWLAGSAWRNCVLNTQSRKDVYFDSDHFILESHIIISGLATKGQDINKAIRYYKPTATRWTQYNSCIKEALAALSAFSLEDVTAAMQNAAQKCLEKVPPDKNKAYLSRETWRKIKTRDQMRINGATTTDMRRLNKEIAKDAKVDKQNSLIEKFNKNPCDKNKKHMWKAVKDLRKKFVPQFVKMKNTNGVHVPLVKRAEAIAEYLASEHWKNEAQDAHPREDKIVEDNEASTAFFTMSELNDAIKATKANKQPGPDGIIMELFKWLDLENKSLLLSLINSWWVNRAAPEELFMARVVPIYKKGDTDVASNYRPISLLNSAYKLYMMMIRSRMQTAIAHRITKTQFGFRPNMSTSHAIYIIRRLQDFAESTSSKLSLAMLDWEKAFDKVQHDKLIIALDRLGFPRHY